MSGICETWFEVRVLWDGDGYGGGGTRLAESQVPAAIEKLQKLGYGRRRGPGEPGQNNVIHVLKFTSPQIIREVELLPCVTEKSPKVKL